MDNRTVVAEELCRWAAERMQFHPRGKHSHSKIPRPEDFKLICRGQVIDIWSFVVNHVHTAQTVRKVKGNLMLNSAPALSGYKVSFRSDKPFNQEREELQEQRQRLSKDLAAVSASICQIETELSRLRSQIVAKEQSYNLAVDRLHDAQRKRALLNACSRHTHQHMAALSEYVTRIQKRAEHLKNLSSRSQESQLMFPKRGLSGKTDELTLEAASTRDVRESCVRIASFLDRVLHAEFDGDKSQLEKGHSELWVEMEKVLNRYGSNQLMSALSAYAQDSLQNIEQLTSAIDIRKDTDSLRFKYESSGRLSDVSSQKTVLNSVQQLLEENQVAMFERFLETEKSTNRTWQLQHRLVQLSDMVDQALVRHYRGNPGALELARSLFQAESLAFSSRSVLKLLEGIADNLKETIGRLSLEKQVIYAKYQQIQDFKKIAEKRQNLIRVLVKQNQSSRSKLQKDQTELLKYADRLSGGHDAELRLMTEQLKDGISREVEVFVRLQMPHLLLTTLRSGDKMAVINLSINKLTLNPMIPCNEVIQRLKKTLKFSEFKGSECLLSHVTQLLAEAMDMSVVLKKSTEMEPTTNSAAFANQSNKRMSLLCEAINDQDRAEAGRLLPGLQKRLGDATNALSGCIRVKDVALCWWEQPAQMCVQWVTVDGLNVQQWRDKWTVAATQMRQLMTMMQRAK